MDGNTPLKQSSDSNGLEKLLMIIIIVVVVGMVAFIWHSKQVADKNLSAGNPTTAKQSAQPPATKQPTTQAQKSAVDLAQTTIKTADTYAQNSSINPSQGEVDAIKADVSPALYSKLSAAIKSRSQYDPIICAQEFPDTFTAALVSTSGSSATVVVTESFGQSQQRIITTVDLGNQQLTGIACPAAPGS